MVLDGQSGLHESKQVVERGKSSRRSPMGNYEQGGLAIGRNRANFLRNQVFWAKIAERRGLPRTTTVGWTPVNSRGLSRMRADVVGTRASLKEHVPSARLKTPLLSRPPLSASTRQRSTRPTSPGPPPASALACTRSPFPQARAWHYANSYHCSPPCGLDYGSY